MSDEVPSPPERPIQGNAALANQSKGTPLQPKWRLWFDRFHAQLHGLSAHRMSVTLFLLCSSAIFIMIIVIALPSARIRIWPRENLVGYTANVLLVDSGAYVSPVRKNVLPLIPIRVTERRVVNFIQISKNFVGENAEVEMTVVNESGEPFTLRAGTRLMNQAGMTFRTLESITVSAGSPADPGVAIVPTRADPEDKFGQVIGERGNVPAGLKWEIPGLSPKEQTFLYARNIDPATGGRTAYSPVLLQKDLDLAQKQLEQELLNAAKVRVEEEIAFRSSRESKVYVVLQYEVLTRISFSGFLLPTQFLDKPVQSVPVEGGLSYGILAYSKDDLLTILLPGLEDHVEEGKELVQGSPTQESISVHVVEYDDDLHWVKITAELTGKIRSELSAKTPAGREFSDRVRNAVSGKRIDEAERIIQNFPEVDRVQVSVWPPWRRSLPALTSNISLLPQE